jgi:hypothetical protein
MHLGDPAPFSSVGHRLRLRVDHALTVAQLNDLPVSPQGLAFVVVVAMTRVNAGLGWLADHL